MKLEVSQHPHLRSKANTQMIMWLVAIALLPAAASGVYFFGVPAVIVLCVSLATSVACDILMQKLTKDKIAWVNGSAVVTGLLFAMVIPPATPFWIVMIGAIFAIAVAKYAFGPGNNIFNPALVARAFVTVSFPSLIAAGYIAARNSIDAVSMATPMTLAKSSGIEHLVSAYGSKLALYKSLLFGNIGGSLGETSAIALLVGAAFLIALKVIDFRIPLVYVGTVFFGSWIFGADPLFHVLAGGLLLGAFFMATDYVTIPITSSGKMIFAFGCGVLTLLFRFLSGMPEGVMYAILLMNMVVPLIDRYTRSRVFGR